MISGLDEYQAKAAKFAVYLDPHYPYYGLMEEVGELMSLRAKELRGDKADYSRERIQKELGDILWNLALIAYDKGYGLSEIADINLAKLDSRLARGEIRGEGDER
ncbi:MAG: MazG nucleotide pyrophosphohydrolase domain-containing protein [Thermodesulfobacteriota bacterium]